MYVSEYSHSPIGMKMGRNRQVVGVIVNVLHCRNPLLGNETNDKRII
jgi:hypothetical protein